MHIIYIPYDTMYISRFFALKSSSPASYVLHTLCMVSHATAPTVFFKQARQHAHHHCWSCQRSNRGALQTRHFSTKDNVTLPKAKTMSKGHRWSLEAGEPTQALLRLVVTKAHDVPVG